MSRILPADMYVEGLNNNTYEELLLIRDEMIEDIKIFERGEMPNNIWSQELPRPEARYAWTLMCLSELFKLIKDKYIEEKVKKGDNGCLTERK